METKAIRRLVNSSSETNKYGCVTYPLQFMTAGEMKSPSCYGTVQGETVESSTSQNILLVLASSLLTSETYTFIQVVLTSVYAHLDCWLSAVPSSTPILGYQHSQAGLDNYGIECKQSPVYKPTLSALFVHC